MRFLCKEYLKKKEDLVYIIVSVILFLGLFIWKNVSNSGASAQNNFDFCIQVLLSLLVLLVVFATCIRLCRKFDKRILLAVLVILNLNGWLTRAFVDQYVLLILGITLLYVVTDWSSTDERWWTKCKVLIGVCILTIVGYFNPPQYTAQLVYSGEDSVDVVWLVYHFDDAYNWCDELEPKGKLFELDDEFFETDEVVISFYFAAGQEANQYEIKAFKVYSNGFLIGSMPGEEIRRTCQDTENLSYEVTDGSELSISCTDCYARMHLNQMFVESVDCYKNADFSSELYAIYYVTTFLIINELLNLLINQLKLCEQKNKWKRICINGGALLCAAIGEEIFIEAVSGSMATISKLAFGLNIILLFGINLLLYAIVNLRISIYITAIASTIIGVANYYTLSYRGTPMMPWDIYSINTALDVVGNYKIYISQKMLWAFFSL